MPRASTPPRATEAGPAGGVPSGRPLRSPAFTLLEVVVAIGVFALTIVAVLGLLSPLQRAVTGVTDFDKAAQLGDAIQTELVRLRDANGGGAAGLDALAALIAREDENPLKLVASRGGAQVLWEKYADSVASTDPLALAPAERYFVVEISEFPEADAEGRPLPLHYTPGAGQGFHAVSARVSWPYRTAASTEPTPAAQRSSLLLNFAVPP